MSSTLDDLKELRDEILLKLHLAGMDAKKQWEELEPKLHDLEGKLERGTEKVAEVAGGLVDDLAGAFRRLRDDLVTELPYGFRATLEDVSFDEARERITETLQQEGFGILTEIDVRATFKKKLDVEFRPYVILGACNPTLAKRALEAEPAIGLLLPCNVVIQENPEGGIDIMVIDPAAMFKLVSNPAVGEIAAEVGQKLERALSAAVA